MSVAKAPREDLRNRLLRRVDWRFLLPHPMPEKTVCFADGLLAQSVKLISDQVIDLRDAGAGDCDLAVAVNPSAATLRAAWSALRPGGACYIEWYSPMIGGAAGARRRMVQAGFADVACYWPWPLPSLRSALFWLPIAAPKALNYFLGSRPPARTIARRLTRVALRSIWRLCLRAGLTLPVCAVGHKLGLPSGQQSSDASSQAPAMSAEQNADLLDVIRREWSTWGFGSAPDRLDWLLLTGGQRSINKVVGLVFGERDRQPSMIVKMARVPEAAPNLLREATVLQGVQSLRASGISGVPQILFCQQQASLVAVGETIRDGRPLYTLLRRANYRDLALRATVWLADLASGTEPVPRCHWWSPLVEPVLADFTGSFGPILDQGMLRETQAMLATLGDLPIVCEHRDFSPWNVLVAPDESLVVLDWESAELQGLPARDLTYFLTYLAFFRDRTIDSRCYRVAYRASLDPSTPTGSVLAECATGYARRVGLALADLQPLRVLTWMLHARSEYQRLVADAAGTPSREALRQSLFVSLWEEELWQSQSG